MITFDSPASGEPASFSREHLAGEVAGHRFLAGMRPEDLRVIADNAMPVSYRAGEIIFKAGDPANRFYLLLSGQVSVETEGSDRAEVLQKIGAGDVLGWSWLFPPYVWEFTARALAPTSAIFIYGTRLRELCETDHDFGYAIMKRVSEVIIQRLQAARRQILAERKGQAA